jgi:hypothetical protein
VSEATNVEAAILRLTRERGPTGSVCPTEVARALVPGEGDAWRQKLSAVRRKAAEMAATGRIEILRKGKPIDPARMRGVIRLRVVAG